ncbi:MAG TPA: YitT family protein [Candidatus Caccomorpha excrementavium]|nr:YitT family protein [Candidatus Caccomorpha excrementavium]
MMLKKYAAAAASDIRRLLPAKRLLSILAGTAVISFGIYNIHRRTNITEGGIFGMLLLLNHWFGLSASLLSPILDFCCYLLGFRFLGRDFLKLSVFASVCLAGFFRLWELIPPLLPDLSASPLTAAILGSLFVGIGSGLIVRQGASGSGDDALALVLSRLMRCRISRAYLITDLSVLALSLSYIPLSRIAYSLVTVILSSLLIDFVQNFGRKAKTEASSP